MPSNRNREVQDVITQARRQGWIVAYRHKHYKLLSPDGRHMVIIPATPSDHRWHGNTMALLRRCGLTNTKGGTHGKAT